jgi:hypothetical protein
MEARPDETPLGRAENLVPAVGLPLNIELIHHLAAPQRFANERSFSWIQMAGHSGQELFASRRPNAAMSAKYGGAERRRWARCTSIPNDK